MEYDYIIIGGGPTAMTIAWLLEDENRKILILEKEKQMGGCHRVQRVDGYFSEHGPRVYSNSYVMFIEILKDLEMEFNDYFTEYDYDLSKIKNQNVSSLSYNEKNALYWAFIRLIFNPNYGKNISIKQFCDDNNFSDKAKEYFEKFCRLTDGASIENYTLFQLLQIKNQQYFYKLYQPKYPNDKGFIRDWEKKLLETNNITIKTEEEVIKLNYNDNSITEVVSIKDSFMNKYKCNKVIITIPPKPLFNLIKDIPGVFLPMKELEDWTQKNSYFDYIPLTFHYKKITQLPKLMGFPKTSWGIGFIILSDFMDFSDEPSKTVISITITFTDRKNEHGKTVNECTKNEIIEYVKEQLPMFPQPDLVIISPNVVKNKNKWINLDTAFVATTQATYLPDTSEKYKNLHIVGIFNGNSNYYFTSIEAAVQNAIVFCQKEVKNLKYEITIKNPVDISQFILIFIVFLVIIVSLIILKMTIFKGFKINNSDK
jgi:protoporphyrinogen oxidase